MTQEQMHDLLRFKRGEPGAPEPEVVPEPNPLHRYRCECGKVFDRFQFDAWYWHLALCPFAKDEEG